MNFNQSKNSIFFKSSFCLTRLVFDDAQPIETEKFSVFKYLTNLFFYFLFFLHHLCLGLTCIAFFFFFCIHLVVLQSYLLLFSQITCIHFAKLGTQLDLKIDWLIFESFVYSSICYFYVRTIENYFLTRYNGYSSATIFSTYATVYGSHSVKFAFIERENICVHV